MISIYRDFAMVYDIFMADIPYQSWAGYIDDAFRARGVPGGGLVLDLACGTGTMAVLMAQKGYDMIAVDNSPAMLSEASAKGAALGILFLEQDMRRLDLFGTVDGAYCACDGLNYMLTEADLTAALQKVAMYLNPGGVFIFDLNTEYKYSQLGQRTFSDVRGKASYIWKNSFDRQQGINEYHVQFFMNGRNSATFAETHRQRAYSTDTVQKCAKKAGLCIVDVWNNYTTAKPAPKSKRLTYIAVPTNSSAAVSPFGVRTFH